ncbi:UPF0301 protein YqgE [Methylophaga frappieri]|uniref:UPF0301 protein Q7C_1946 n=1 Tax=Methylophaga frappieri (strain ATCC BAA-2434 / DSM 25690 / JAM7) TaxID=754477 RepID=I1YJJ4_METFJ|nr:YqgE/AlgH family protein [Methylophaga frappieri]AFJ03087.1 UPF0301 protein YqgE [Methylophaga frappieri]
MQPTYLKNHLLIAMPGLHDQTFHQAVVYLCEHDAYGAMGLIINRPSKIKLAELLQHLKIDNQSEQIHHGPVLYGGPLKKEQGLVLHNGGQYWKNTLNVAEQLYLTSSSDILADIGTSKGPENALVSLGYAGWDTGQLESELAENSWLTVPATPEILFNTAPSDRWAQSARLLGIDIHLLSHQSGHA